MEHAGGTYHELSDNKLDQITHIIADTPDFSAYQDACDAFLHVVKPSWVEHSLTRNRLANTRQHRPDPALVLSDTCVVIAGDIPQGDKDAIIGGVQAMGGQFSTVMMLNVTHVVALSMDNPQCKIIADKKLACKPVLPHWFDHCLTLGKKIDCTPYVLPNPSILSHEGAEAELKDKTKYSDNIEGLKNASLLHPRFPEPVSPSKSRKELTVFSCKKIKLADDLELNGHLKDSITALIRRSHGEVIDDIDDADILICRHRSGLDFREALDAGKDIGSLGWLYHLINTNRYTSPLRKLLHFPIPRKPLAGFDTFQISVSNYTGEARVYLESLIKAAGGTFTKTMTQNNTHLITAHSMSEKVDAAREWSIATVNHLWLEESYAKCKGQALTNPRYTTFPSRTNLGEVIGQTQLDHKVLQEHYLPHRQQLGEQLAPIKMEESTSTAKTPARSGTLPVITPAAHEKENLTPGSRGAKDRAINKLHQMAPDITAFQKEMKRRGGVVFGGRRVADSDRVPLQTSNGAQKRSIERASGEHYEVEQSPSMPKRKKSDVPKTQALSQSTKTLKLVVTGGSSFEWYNTKKRQIRDLGVRELDNVPADGKIDVLVTHKVLRTPNFLAAVAAGVPILRPQWLEDVLEKGTQLGFDGYALCDRQWEQEIGTSLEDVLARAREAKPYGGLFRGRSVYCTENVPITYDTVSDIVHRNGGSCHPFKGREGSLESSNEATEQVFLVSVPRNKKLWTKFNSIARKSGLKPQVVTMEWLLRVAILQDREQWNDAWALG